MQAKRSACPTDRPTRVVRRRGGWSPPAWGRGCRAGPTSRQPRTPSRGDDGHSRPAERSSVTTAATTVPPSTSSPRTLRTGAASRREPSHPAPHPQSGCPARLTGRHAERERRNAWSGGGESLLGGVVEDESVVEPDTDRDAEHPSLVGDPLLFQGPHLLLQLLSARRRHLVAEVVEERLEAQVLTDLVALLPVMLVHTLDGALDACCQGHRDGEGTRLLRGSPAGVTDPANRRSAASRTRWPTFSVIDPSSSSSVTGDPVNVASPGVPERTGSSHPHLRSRHDRSPRPPSPAQQPHDGRTGTRRQSVGRWRKRLGCGSFQGTTPVRCRGRRRATARRVCEHLRQR